MADVTGPDAGSREDLSSEPDRAQLILVVGLALAVTLVALALLLNAAIYSENFASRQSHAPIDGVAGTGEHIERGLAKTLGYVNERNADNLTYAELRANFTAAAANWTELRNRELSLLGATMNVTTTSTTTGTRIRQTNSSRNFTAGDGLNGAPDWVLVSDVWSSPRFELNVSRKDLYSASFDTSSAAMADSAFHVYFTNGTHEWRVYVFEGAASNSVYVLTENPGEDFSGTPQGYDDFATDACSSRTDWVVLRFQEGTLGDRSCDELAFVSGFDEQYDIHFHNATQTDVLGDEVVRGKGTYDLIVGKSDVDRTPYFSAADDASPYTLTALANATVEYRYRTGGVTVTDTMVVEPDTFGAYARESRPVLDDVNVVDNSASDGSIVAFDVEWTVIDRDGDLSEVEVVLTDENGMVVDRKTTTVSGDSASGTTSFSSIDPTAMTDSDDRYGIQVDVVDSEDNSAAVPYQRTHVADGDDAGDPP